MPVKKYKPTTAGRRNYSVNAFAELTGDTPEKSLLRSLKKTGGRNNYGRITVRHRGGGHKRMYRLIDFKGTDKLNLKASVKSVEYDPNRSAFISLVSYLDGEKRYILAYDGIKVGDEIITAEKAPVKSGNRMMLKNIPNSYKIFNIELFPGKGGQVVKSA
ncbi:50S ribosomal protein L2, partial [Candidatus Peregrinibacteria bacterium]|nr:50S ribosomal protein L2 [Candidatus Peregrinibacteria bacterium]